MQQNHHEYESNDDHSDCQGFSIGDYFLWRRQGGHRFRPEKTDEEDVGTDEEQAYVDVTAGPLIRRAFGASSPPIAEFTEAVQPRQPGSKRYRLRGERSNVCLDFLEGSFFTDSSGRQFVDIQVAMAYLAAILSATTNDSGVYWEEE